MQTLNQNVLPEVMAGIEEMTALRRDLHAHPELGFCEVRTAGIAARILREIGCDAVEEGVGKTGVVALIRGGARNPEHPLSIALRADMDALPLEERTGLPWASVLPNRMHGCGHDGHVAACCSPHRPSSSGASTSRATSSSSFSPAKKAMRGARAMIEDGLFERFPTTEIYGIHAAGELRWASWASPAGPRRAAADRFLITVKGVGGHGARPHKTVDPIVASAFSSRPFRRSSPARSTRCSPPSSRSARSTGATPRASRSCPAEVVLAGTTRCARPEDRDTIEARMGEICSGIAATTGADIDFRYTRMYPPLVNHDEQYAFASNLARELYGEARVNANHPASMGAEDFSFFLEKRPGCFVRMGIADDSHRANHHHPCFDYNDLALGPTADFFVRLVEARLAALVRQRSEG